MVVSINDTVYFKEDEKKVIIENVEASSENDMGSTAVIDLNIKLI